MPRLVSILKSTRLWGLLGTAGVLWFLLFVVFGRVDMSWIMPDTGRMARDLMRAWPQMPFFTVHRAPATNAAGVAKPGEEWVYYTVPTRQFTPQELAQMGATNAVAHPAPAH